jgi:hypothetical protein
MNKIIMITGNKNGPNPQKIAIKIKFLNISNVSITTFSKHTTKSCGWVVVTPLLIWEIEGSNLGPETGDPEFHVIFLSHCWRKIL